MYTWSTSLHSTHLWYSSMVFTLGPPQTPDQPVVLGSVWQRTTIEPRTRQLGRLQMRADLTVACEADRRPPSSSSFRAGSTRPWADDPTAVPAAESSCPSTRLRGFAQLRTSIPPV